jgi:hypothetical protein
MARRGGGGGGGRGVSGKNSSTAGNRTTYMPRKSANNTKVGFSQSFAGASSPAGGKARRRGSTGIRHAGRL